jgi:16S rRNA (cytosine967-C5)-methyltransferase
MKFDNQLRYAVHIIEKYDGRVPLSVWLREFFRNNKQMGSRDRKTVSEMVFGYYRLGHNEFSSVEERIKAFICVSSNLPELKKYFFPDEKQVVEIDHDKIFPFKDLLSSGIDEKAFSRSFLIQPDLFVRVRPGNTTNVFEKLVTNGINYKVLDENCIAFSNSTKIEAVLDINREVVVQDRSSQKTGSFIKQVYEQVKNHPAVWDCCAGSGGKSILAHDVMENLNLTVSDIRKQIIENLVERFKQAGIINYECFIADLANPGSVLTNESYELVIADVPCTGSGTWARTPEQLFFFIKEKINQYTELQKKIVSRVVTAIKPNGYFLYITCSVFAGENEKMTDYISEKHSLKLLRSELITGYNDKADTLYAALFTN